MTEDEIGESDNHVKGISDDERNMTFGYRFDFWSYL